MDPLLSRHISFDNQESLKTSDGNILQLLGVCALGEYASLQIGKTLRNFVLLLAVSDPSISIVTAMTRCSNFPGGTLSAYQAYVNDYSTDGSKQHKDATISFHVSAGARVCQIVQNFRQNDHQNLGHAVNIQYEFAAGECAMVDTENERSVVSNGNSSSSGRKPMEMGELFGIIEQVLSPQHLSYDDRFEDRAFMNMGLDSLQMMEITIDLKRKFPEIPISSTMLFDFPTPNQLLKSIHELVSGMKKGLETKKQQQVDDRMSLPPSSHHHPLPLIESTNQEHLYAVVAASCCFPDAESPEEFFENMCNKIDSVGDVPPDWASSSSDAVKLAAFLKDDSTAHEFTPSSFGLSHNEAIGMDPHHRILLSVAFRALQESNIIESSSVLISDCFPKSKNVGVFCGLSNNDFIDSLANSNSNYDSDSNRTFEGINTASSSAANRISHAFRLTGPSMIVDTACSSSLSALHVACGSLRSRDCDAAVVAAADLLVSARSLEIRKNANMLSKDGRCKVFDEMADGYVRGEGAAAVVIKRLEDAEREHKQGGPEILGVVRSTVMNHNGTSAEFTAPNGSSQRALLSNAILQARISVDDMVFIESHGTGTKLGDPIEFGAIKDEILLKRSSSSGPLIIGACKTNIGHLEAAAGLAGFIKTLMVLRKMKVPPNLHLSNMNSILNIPDIQSSVIFPSEILSIDHKKSASNKICAGVSSFGSGGTNAHAILQKYENQTSNDISKSNLDLTDVDSFSKMGATDPVCFMFTGQASNYCNMGLDLYISSATFRAKVDHCSEKLKLVPSLSSFMYPSLHDDKVNVASTNTETIDAQNVHIYAHCSIVVLELALVAFLEENGCRPAVVCGHSLGEYAACVCAGILTEDDCLFLVLQRARILSTVVSKGIMVATRASREEAQKVIDDKCDKSTVAVGVVNGPASIVLSGEESSIAKVLQVLGKSSKQLEVAYPFHSPLMKTSAEQFSQVASNISWCKEGVRATTSFISCINGETLDTSSIRPNAYWANHLIHPVLFSTGVKNAIERGSARIFLEIGPQSTLKNLGPGCCNDPNIKWLACLDKDVNTIKSVRRAISICTGKTFGGVLPTLMTWRCLKSNRVRQPFFATTNAAAAAVPIDKYMIQDMVKDFLPVNFEEFKENVSLFQLGLDSLGAIEIQHRISTLMKPRKFPANFIHVYPTIEKLTAYLLEYDDTNVTPVECEGFSKVKDDSKSLLSTRFPVTFLQNGIIVESSKYPYAYVEYFEWSVDKNFDLSKFADSFESIIMRHDSLRSSFDLEVIPQIEQVIWPFNSEVFGPQKWLEVCTSNDEGEEEDLVQFDISTPPLFSMKISGEYRKRIRLFIHHLLVDGVSMNILVKDIVRAYQGKSDSVISGDASNLRSFSNYALAEKEYLKSSVYEAGSHYWMNCLKSVKLDRSVLRLDCDMSMKDADRIVRTIDPIVAANLMYMARVLGVTLNSILHSIWSTVYYSLLQRNDQQQEDMNMDILYGYTTAGRSLSVEGIESIVGPLVNTLPMLFLVNKGSSIATHIASMHQKLVENLQFETYPLVKIQRLLPYGTKKLFSAIFDFQHANWNLSLSKNTSLEFVGFHDKVGYPLSVRVFQYPNQSLQMLLQSESSDFTETDLLDLHGTFDYLLHLFASIKVDEVHQINVNRILKEERERNKSKTVSAADSSDTSIDNASAIASIGDEDLKTTNSEVFDNFQSMIIEVLRSIWATVLSKTSDEIKDDSNFFSLGGDSLLSIQVVARCRKAGLVDIKIPDIFNSPVFADLVNLISKSHKQAGPTVLGTHEKSNNYDTPFPLETRLFDTNAMTYPLIGINQAHFVGLHTSAYSKDGLAPQIYFEWDIINDSGEAAPLNVMVFNQAIDIFLKRHLVFRSYCGNDGNMQILEFPPPYNTKVIDLCNNCGSEESQHSTRHQMTRSNLNPFEWPLFEFVAIHTSPHSTTLHVRVSLLLMDAIGDLVFRQELSTLYRAGMHMSEGSLESCAKAMMAAVPLAPRLQFDTYCRAVHDKLRGTAEYKRSQQFWNGRLSTLSEGPQLPLLPTFDPTGDFINHCVWLSSSEWSCVKKNCLFHGITIPVALLTVYAISIQRWSGQSRFLINILQCLRLQIHEDANKMVGNCSSTVICDINLGSEERKPLSFLAIARRVATELAQNLEHSIVSGIDVMQELNRLNGKTFNVVAPFIFTCPIGVESSNDDVRDRNWIFNETFFSERVPHTACVNAVKEYKNGTACASLDIIEGIFPTDVVHGLSITYTKLLRLLGSSDVLQYNATANSVLGIPHNVKPISFSRLQLPSILLHEGLFSNEIKSQSNSAVIQVSGSNGENDTILSYHDLKRHVHSLVTEFRKYNILDLKHKHSVIAVVMYKGWEQVVSVLSILFIGCVYLPIDAQSWSENRICSVLELSGAVLVCTQTLVLRKEKWLHQIPIPVIDVNRVQPSSTHAIQEDPRFEYLNSRGVLDSDLAYLIYTSGSTGVPKGVSCHHKGAVNTLMDLNDQFFVNETDRVFAISSLSFDLSVYDIFGLLFAGGVIVLPPANTVSPPDPDAWIDIVQIHGITIWNSVPAFLDLLVSQLELDKKFLPSTLRLILLSGDWLPTTLTRRVRDVSLNKNIRIISMGGATEASIWSNMFELGLEGDGIPESWTTVPYGQPLRNQTMYILDEYLVHCEDWVTGEIYIGGVGVAEGYYNDVERSRAQFILHPSTGEKLFKTGDLGRVHSELIEILGRKDSQVKVNGFRIELGEIEKTLKGHEFVQSAVLVVHKNNLCAYLVLNRQPNDENALKRDLGEFCRERLTSYMVPRYFVFIEKLHLSANGKVQRDKLISPIEEEQIHNDDEGSKSLSKTNLEVREIFCAVLNIGSVGSIDSSFFSMGGTSITAIQLLFQIQSRLGVKITVSELFQAPTVSGVSTIVEDKLHTKIPDMMDQNIRGKLRFYCISPTNAMNLSSVMVLVNPAGASGLCYMELAKSLTKYTVYVIDDDVVASGAEFPFSNIQEVVDETIHALKSLTVKHGLNSVVLGGWSYGGVVAFLTAKSLIDKNKLKEGPKIDFIVTFDAPIVDSDVSPELALDNRTTTVNGDEEEEVAHVDGVSERATIHFEKCTSILQEYYSSGKESKSALDIPFLDIRPESVFSRHLLSGQESEKDLSSSYHFEYLTPGNHWTMIFGSNVTSIVNTIDIFVKRCGI